MEQSCLSLLESNKRSTWNKVIKMSQDNTKRFSDRVNDYIKYRPNYPIELISILKESIELSKDKIVADIGSGTGISSQLFLENHNVVYGVEPNKEMREAQELILNKYNNFRSINGTAEATTLPTNEIDIIFVGQAFHWFDKNKSKIEFNRILKDTGNIVLVWNSRNINTDFQKEYEYILVNNIEEYKNINHRNIDNKEITSFLYPKQMRTYNINNEQQFDLEGLKGRLKSSSYCPKEGKEYEKLMREIENLFIKYEENNQVNFTYKTEIYLN